MEERIRGGRPYLVRLPEDLLNLQSKRISRMAADRHRNLGNELFHCFLDPLRQDNRGRRP